MSGVVTLLTDFGLEDEYVGVIKGVIAACNASINVIDICHNIPPHNVAAAAYMLEAAFGHFLSGSVHVCVVDPDVGSARKLLGAAFGGHYFIAPDNGLLTFLLDEPELRLYDLQYAQPAYATFHGRDVIAPLAARVAGGAELSELGPPLNVALAVRLPNFRAGRRADGAITGMIIWSDHFGNLMTNIRQSDLTVCFNNLADICIEFNGEIFPFRTYYAEAETGAKLALINSRGYLELAINAGNLAQDLGFAHFSGLPVVILYTNKPCKLAGN